MPYVTERWLGGTLTNNETIRSSVRRLDEIEREMADPAYFRSPKKVQARNARERRRILRNLEGVRNMVKLPDAIFIVDPGKDQNAVKEGQRRDIPIIALNDTDSDPTQVNLPIPGNDDGIRSIQLVLKTVVDSYPEARRTRSRRARPRSTRPEGRQGDAKADAKLKHRRPMQLRQRTPRRMRLGDRVEVTPKNTNPRTANLMAITAAQVKSFGNRPIFR